MGNLVATFGAFGDLALESPSLLAPAFRLSVQGSLPTTVNATATNDSATLTWVFARTEACPLRVALSSSVDARPCAFVDGGILDAAGGGPANAQTKLGPWVTAGALARVTWLRELSARWALVLEAQAGLVVPIVRQTFTFVPEITVYQAPAVTGLASIGAGVRFP